MNIENDWIYALSNCSRRPYVRFVFIRSEAKTNWFSKVNFVDEFKDMRPNILHTTEFRFRSKKHASNVTIEKTQFETNNTRFLLVIAWAYKNIKLLCIQFNGIWFHFALTCLRIRWNLSLFIFDYCVAHLVPPLHQTTLLYAIAQKIYDFQRKSFIIIKQTSV